MSTTGDSSSDETSTTVSDSHLSHPIGFVEESAEGSADSNDLSDREENPSEHFDGVLLDTFIDGDIAIENSFERSEDSPDEINPAQPGRRQYRTRLDLELDDWLDPSLPRLYQLSDIEETGISSRE